MNERGFKIRVAVAALVMGAVLLGLGARLASLHLGSHDELRARLNRNRRFEKELRARRGSLYDRHGKRNILALNTGAKDVCADPTAVQESGRTLGTACELAELLDVPTDLVAVRLKEAGRQFAYVRRFVEDDRAARVMALKLPGVFLRESSVRHYPHSEFMCHVLGFVNHEGVGSAGVEQHFDQQLRGSPGMLEGQLDALRHELYVRRDRHVPALCGADVTLTLDQNVQYVVERALDEAMSLHSARAAWAIVSRVGTGEILAMASRPAYDVNAFAESGEEERLNRAIGHVYEPGSTFKTAVFAAALDAGTVTPGTVIDCERGAWWHEGRILRDYHAYGELSVADGLKKSSNILAAKVALTLGKQRMYERLTAFGLGRPMGVDLPGEEGGILVPAARWSRVKLSRVAIGQGVAVTALQMLGIVSAIANDGVLMRPYVVKEIRAGDDGPVWRTEPEVLGRPIRPATASLMRRLLARVTEDGGTGRRARIEGYRVGGKTGTAQKPKNGVYSEKDYMASFVGFLPADDPEIAVIVVVDEPQPLHTGGRVAAAVFQEIVSHAVRCLEIAPAVGRLAGRPAARSSS